MEATVTVEVHDHAALDELIGKIEDMKEAGFNIDYPEVVR